MGWKESTAKVLRPNLECTNGVIHLIDTVFIDDAPPWTIGMATRFTVQLQLISVSVTLSLLMAQLFEFV